MGPLLLKVCYTSIPLLPNPTPPPSPFILPPFPHSSASCVCMYMHARLLTCVSHRSPLRRRLPSWGDAWAPPVNFTAFIWPDEWLAALSVPLPAISSGSLEPHTACRFFGRSLQHAPIPLLLHTHQTLRDAQLHTDDTVLHAQFRKQHAHEPNKQCSNRSGRKLCRAPKPLLPLGRKLGKKSPAPSTKAKDSAADKADESVSDKEQVSISVSVHHRIFLPTDTLLY